MHTLNLEHEGKLAVHLGLLHSHDPIKTTEKVVEQQIETRLKHIPNDDPGQLRGVRDICHGAMQGLYKEHVRLSVGAVAVLRGAVAAAADLKQDEQTMIAYALAGIADIAQRVSAEMLASVQQEIEREFAGSGEIFGRLVTRHSAKRDHVLHAHRRHEE